jgi:hypothetical protein
MSKRWWTVFVVAMIVPFDDATFGVDRTKRSLGRRGECGRIRGAAEGRPQWRAP